MDKIITPLAQEVIDKLFAALEAKTGNKFLQLIEKELNVAADGLVSDFAPMLAALLAKYGLGVTT